MIRSLFVDPNGQPSDLTETLVIGSVIISAAIWLVYFAT